VSSRRARPSTLLRAVRLSLAAAAGAALLPTASVAQTSMLPTLVTSHIAEGVVHNRLVPLGGAAQPHTGAWTTERRFTDDGGTPAVLQVMTIGAPGHLSVDSLLFDRATLLPIWERFHGAATRIVSFAGRHVTGRITRPDSADRAIDVTTAGPAYSGTIDDVIVQSVPLTPGYTVVISCTGGEAVEIDTIRVRRRERVPTRAGPGEAWAVDLVYPTGSETLWLDPATRAIVRHIYTRADHSQLEMISN